MARLEAQSKLLYYPTPVEMVDFVSSWFFAESPVRLVDPCCGEGEALHRFSKRIMVRNEQPVELWGVEVSYARAEKAMALLDKVLPVSFYDCTPAKWSPASCSLAFVNPPYDWSDFKETRNGKTNHLRHELLFVEHTTPKLVTGGHQVIIVPQGILGDSSLVGVEQAERFARHLLGWYSEYRIFRFLDGYFEKFSQVVVLAIKKRAKYASPKEEQIAFIVAQANAQVPELPPPPHAQFPIPPTPGPAKFTYNPVSPSDLVRLAKKCSPIGTQEFERETYVRPIGAAFTPAVPLSLGHMTMLITGQETGVLHLDHMLAKGSSRKVVTVASQDKTNEKGEYTSTSVTETEKHTAALALAHADGKMDLLITPEEVSDFVTKYATPLAEAILSRNQPLYNWQPSKAEWDMVGRCALGLPPLPGREERGLFTVQKHFAIAATRVMKKYGAAIMNCEMGFGVRLVSC